MKEQIQKDKRVNSRFLTALLVAEAALRPIANDWAHLDEGELNDIIRCLHTINDLQGQARAYEDYLNKQLQTADAVREGGRGDTHDKNNLRLVNLQRQAKLLLRYEERKLLHSGGRGDGFQSQE